MNSKRNLISLLICLFSIANVFCLPPFSYAATPDPVTLNTPGAGDLSPSSVTLTWDESTTAPADFFCYKVLRSKTSGFTNIESIYGWSIIPTLGTMGIIILLLLIIYSVYRQQKIIAALIITSLFLFGGFSIIDATVEDPWLSDWIKTKSTTTYTDSGLDASTTYYYKVYVFSQDNSYAASNEVQTATTAVIDLSPPSTSFSIPEGTHTYAQILRLTCSDGSGNGCAATYYTTDGTTPTVSSSAYSDAIVISSDTTVKAFSVDVEGNTESVQTKTFTISVASCGTQSTMFNTEPLDPASYDEIDPLGNLAPSGHTFPTVHTYMMLSNETSPVNMYSPGDITITKVARMTTTSNGFIDYVLNFTACAEVFGYFDHVTSPSSDILSQVGTFTNCWTYSDGSDSFERCENEVSIVVSGGTLLATVGDPNAASGALDFGLRDVRTTPITYANPSAITNPEQLYVVCPYDYYETGTVRDNLFAKLQVARIVSPVCGTVALDVSGTAQGLWYLKGSDSYSESDGLALVPSNRDPAIEVLSVGNSSVGTGDYYFDFVSSGTFGRNFSDVTSDGTIYCYDTLRNREATIASGRAQSVQGYLFLQMTTNTELKLERVNSSASCPADTSTLAFSSSAVDFVR